MFAPYNSRLPTQSYEEFFLWKLGAERLNVHPTLLRTLDWKEALAAIAESGSGTKPDLAYGKDVLRAYARASVASEGTPGEANNSAAAAEDIALVARRRSKDKKAPLVTEVNKTGFFRALGMPLDAPDAAEKWSAVVKAAGERSDAASPEEEARLDFHQFLVGVCALGLNVYPAQAVGGADDPTGLQGRV